MDVNKKLPLPVNLSTLSNEVKNYVVKKDVYNAQIKNIEDERTVITNLATNTSLYAKINKVKKEVASITNSATTTAFNAKINKVKYKKANITNLATTTALTAVKNEIPNVRNLVKKK